MKRYNKKILENIIERVLLYLDKNILYVGSSNEKLYQIICHGFPVLPYTLDDTIIDSLTWDLIIIPNSYSEANRQYDILKNIKKGKIRENTVILIEKKNTHMFNENFFFSTFDKAKVNYFLYEEVLDKMWSACSKITPNVKTTKTKLIDTNFVKSLSKDTTLYIDKDTIITPAARDEIVSQRITILRNEGNHHATT